MKPAAKYLFDEDFAASTKPTITMVEHERRSADVEALAHRKGFAAGEAKAQGDAAQRTATALALIAEGLERLHRALGSIELRLETEAVEVAVAVGAKLAPELMAREPFAEISALATECFLHLVKTPHVGLRIGADIYDTAKDKLEEIARVRGFEGRLMVTSDASMAAGDCRIEWADGGVVRDRAATIAAIDDMVGRYVAARATH
jgi:flagellar assembly protein FliH